MSFTLEYNVLREERRIMRIDERLVQIATVLMTRSSGCALC